MPLLLMLLENNDHACRLQMIREKTALGSAAEESS
jgi:hypothetical protein